MDTKRLQGLICAGMLSGALVLTGVANAAVVTNRLPLLGYADHNISVYRAPGGMTSAVVAAETALIQITQVRADGWAYGTYPMSNGRRASGWFRMNDVQGDVNFNNVNGKILYQQTVYRTTAMSGGNGVLPQGASVLVIAEQGGLSQIVYKQPNSMNWRLGWVLSDAVQKEQKIVAPVNQTRSSVTSQAKTSSATKTAAQPKTNVDTKTTEQPKTSVVTKTVAQSGTDTASKNVAQKPELNTEIKTTTSTQPTASNNTVQASKNTTVVKNSNQNRVQQQKEATGSPNAQQGNIIVLDTNNASSLQLGQTRRKVVNKYGKVLQQAPAYPNANLTNRQNGEYAGKGDMVIVLEEFGHSYKITYPAKDRLKDRWVYKDNISLNAGVNYQSWQGTMINRADVYHDLNLQLHPVATEYAEKGDTVTVLNEALNSYFISYPLTNGSYKARWVEKSAVSGPNPNNRVVVPVVKEDTNPFMKPVERTNNGIKGDMNQDGKVDQTDLDIMKNIIVEKIPSNNVYKQVGDMNSDGNIDIIDLSQLVSLVSANTKSDNTTTNNQFGKSVTLANLKVVYPVNGLYSIQPMCAPNTELTVQGASKNEGSNVFIYSIASDWHKEPSHQKWYIERIGNTEWYKITAENSGHALNIHGGTSVNGTNVSIWPYSSNARHHQFRFLDAGNGYYVIQGNISGNFVLDVNNAGNANETNVQVYEYNGSNAQKWKLVKRASAVTGGMVYGLGNVINTNKTETAKRYVQVFPDANLASPYQGRFIDKGENYSVIGQSENALHVKYKSGNGEDREGWVSNQIREEIPVGSYVWPIPNHQALNTIYYYNGRTGADGKYGGTHSCRYYQGGKGAKKTKPYGIDIQATTGNTVVAIASGRVITAADLGNSSFGKYIEIDHGDGRISLYAHLSQILVSVGNEVSANTKIGLSGNSGNSGGAHLHFEMSWQDPYEYYKNNITFSYSSGLPAQHAYNRVWVGSTTVYQRQK